MLNVSDYPEGPVVAPAPLSLLSWPHRLAARLEGLTPTRAALLVFAVGLFSSLFINFVVRPLRHFNLPFGGEPYDGYIELAQNLVAGNGYVFEPGGPKVFHRPPLYPLLLMPGVLLPESCWRIYVAVLNCGLLAAAATIVLWWGKKLFGSPVGWLSWLLFAFNPWIHVSLKNPLSTSCQMLAYLLMLLLTWMFLKKVKEQARIPALFVLAYAGALMMGAFSHGTMLADATLFVALGAGFAIRRRHMQAFKSVLITYLLLISAIAPWTWRNYQITGSFIPIAGNAGFAYFAGNARWGITGPAAAPGELRHTAELRHAGVPSDNPKEVLFFYGFTNPEYEKITNQRYKQHIREHPGAFLKKIFINAVEYYWPLVYYVFPPPDTYAAQAPLSETLRKEANPDTVPITLYNLVFVSLSFCGFCYLMRRKGMRKHALLLAFAWAVFALPYFPFLTFISHTLYTFGTIPVLAVLTSIYLLKPKSLPDIWGGRAGEFHGSTA
jgi:hypothetical protein